MPLSRSDTLADDYGKHYAVLGYKVGPRVLDVSRDLNFVSMKDQIIRGRWAVDALVAAGGLRTGNAADDGNGCDLLVVGAGAAGVSAAMRAADRNVRTWLVDREPDPFTRQGQSDRLISMSLYDWPAQHWDKAPWPHDEPVAYPKRAAPPSMLTAPSWLAGGVVGPAKAFAWEWLHQFNAMRSSSSLLRFWPVCGLESPTPIKKAFWRSGRMKVRLRFGPGANRAGQVVTVFPQFVLLALGPGIERVAVPDSGGSEFAGPRFWVGEYREDQNGQPVAVVDPDHLLDSVIRNDAGAIVKKLIVSGAGDGGVQDFLRAALEPAFHDLQEIVTRLRKIDVDAWTTLERDVAAAEWQTERARQLGAGDAEVFPSLHARTEIAVINWMSGDNKKREPLVLSEIVGMLRTPMPEISWLLGKRAAGATASFTKTYALNRVLGILLLRCATFPDFPGNVTTFLADLTSVTSTSAGNWKVHPSDGPSFDADFVILRHGVKRSATAAYTGRQRYVGLRKAFERLVPPFKPLG